MDVTEHICDELCEQDPRRYCANLVNVENDIANDPELNP